ncbi:alpha/beta fold hydrolase [Arthrobacter mobilis]|uniref:Alpha/beta hydrolase n=1 Tax=Arthrobacter mobilis TaxID=2724944 RepID=A0A7X6HEL5_9MICC|nr:alpha/beta fold hydrolase [Arthrobacter mobilis]NKX55646.1 alpha/beta hydrolase [Arthrobacter mobilis]
MPTVHVNGIELYYEELGEGDAILGIHGTPSSALLWAEAAGELAGHGRCITYDRRGFYRSSRPKPFTAVDLAEHVADAAALLDALAAVPAVVIGRSTGGLVALELARRFPDKVRALVLLEPAVFSLDPEAAAWAGELRQRVLQAAEEDPGSAAETVLREVLGDREWATFPEVVKTMLDDTSPAVLAEIRGRGLDLSAEASALTGEELAGIGQPALVVSARDSPEALRRVTARLTEALPRSEAVLVDGGHLINPAHPAVLEFIDGLSRRQARPVPRGR